MDSTCDLTNKRVDALIETLRGIYPGSCREWIEDPEHERYNNRCGNPSEFVLWGKLINPEGLGPRCYDHAARYVGHDALRPNSEYAVIDLRPILKLRGIEPKSATDIDTQQIYRCNKCYAPKGKHALGEACNNNCGGTVVRDG